MSKPISSFATSILLTSVLAGLSTACGSDVFSALSDDESASTSSPAAVEDTASVTSSNTPSPAAATIPSPASSPAASTTIAVQPSPVSDPYPEAINRASSAFNLGQSAQSQDDWRLVASRWQQAIDLMGNVPASSPNHAIAQNKLQEYRRNLTVAQQLASRQSPSSSPSPGRVVAVSPSGSRSPLIPLGQSSNTPRSEGRNGNGVYQAPIIRRAGGTPVILVTFNGSQPFEMIVDTGASGTVITQRMAAELGVVPIGQTRVATASASSAVFTLGRVSSVEVDGAVSRDVVVAIAGPELSTGLLGHDFFGNYDVTVRESMVEFRER